MAVEFLANGSGPPYFAIADLRGAEPRVDQPAQSLDSTSSGNFRRSWGSVQRVAEKIIVDDLGAGGEF